MRFQPSSYSLTSDRVAPMSTPWIRFNPTPTTSLVDAHDCVYDVLEDGSLKLVSGNCGDAGLLITNYSDEWKALINDMLAIEQNREKLINAYGEDELNTIALEAAYNKPPFYKKPIFWVAIVGGTAVLGTAVYLMRQKR